MNYQHITCDRDGVQALLEKQPPQFPGKVSEDMPSQYPWWK